VVTAVAFYETDVQLTVKASTFDCRDVLEMNRLSLSLSMPRSFLQKYHVIADIYFLQNIVLFSHNTRGYRSLLGPQTGNTWTDYFKSSVTV